MTVCRHKAVGTYGSRRRCPADGHLLDAVLLLATVREKAREGEPGDGNESEGELALFSRTLTGATSSCRTAAAAERRKNTVSLSQV